MIKVGNHRRSRIHGRRIDTPVIKSSGSRNRIRQQLKQCRQQNNRRTRRTVRRNRFNVSPTNCRWTKLMCFFLYGTWRHQKIHGKPQRTGRLKDNRPLHGLPHQKATTMTLFTGSPNSTAGPPVRQNMLPTPDASPPVSSWDCFHLPSI